MILFFDFDVVDAARRFLGISPELAGIGLWAAKTPFPIRFILDQKSLVDCRNSSAIDMGYSPDFEAHYLRSLFTLKTAICIELFHSPVTADGSSLVNAESQMRAEDGNAELKRAGRGDKGRRVNAPQSIALGYAEDRRCVGNPKTAKLEARWQATKRRRIVSEIDAFKE